MDRTWERDEFESDGASTHRSRRSEAKTKEEFEQQRKERADESRRRAAEEFVRMENYRFDVEGIEQTEAEKDKAWEGLCKALKTDPKTIQMVRRAGFMRGFINLTFLLVLTGCELDLYGFGMAYADYWALDQLFLRVLLITGPVSYLLACALYMYFSGEVEQRQEEERRREEESARQNVQNPYLSGAESPRQVQPGQTRVVPAKQPVKLRFYHFLPLCRYFLVVKEKETDDVESLFRINSLSSFALGIAQICGIVFSGLATDWEFSVFTYINIASQVINWSITIMYFMTPVATKMGNAMKVDAMAYNSELRLRRLWEQWLMVVQEKSHSNSAETNSAMRRFVENIDREIIALANIMQVDLRPFSMKKKFTALKFLQWQNIQTYAEI
mmetsp:Transcript_74794/g.173254  ORF Transcript_74794/g.173254 Transcript_74794/m.173254 type:complete len:386 (-) Transcript_74794:114-1271(-)|eukprot:CAMPEP_0171107742 /NCGR_PEP_ID=MMETSP0766_2-20121228/67471_1 /TAXON_ID=439317 /ORGANISM="Gambierdiscus australes, Strain CAWD 149" /LENGTH=385 /DNA_ID=CAMNT_0011569127 /DNA_START=61 /DNA_END=1218 /DNA_ORIENTATION=+